VLVKEYIDDGYSGSELDRPALDQMRLDAKIALFDAIYFLGADRIAREVAYQTIIVGEFLKHGKQIIINGKDYVHNPENRLTLTMLGAFAEFGRATMIERTTRGRLHRLRMGELSSTGHRIFGYDYVKKTPTSPAALVINEEQAAVVRSIFEMFASGNFGVVTISRCLEERRVPRAAIIILGLMGENNPPHRKSMEHVAKFAILNSARLLQALQSVRTIEVPLRYGAIHRKKTTVGAD